ncbi:MAG: hypothetical protein J0M35_12945 [Candidatus Obscuribacter phosphatis]|uniref:Uncharacterized protein n=1 Tax=Candidatus Obscuribacter phosphatis TaxID=1906157 RepID=A0A8J7PB67_9BACT|nr:hypothetical protein [Candidatus Obscuribacter phosphatis]
MAHRVDKTTAASALPQPGGAEILRAKKQEKEETNSTVFDGSSASK